MKRMAKYLHIGMLFSLPLFAADCCTDSCSLDTTCSDVKTAFVPLSIGTDLSNQYHKIRYPGEEDDCDWYFDLNGKYIYSSTRNGKCLAKNLLGDSTLKFQGAYNGKTNLIETVNNTTGTYTANDQRKDGALVATYFGFARDADFSIDLCPKIQNHKIDLQFAFGGEKVWFQLNAPIVYSKWQINKSGTPKTTGSLGTKTLQDGDAGGTFQYSAGNVLQYKSSTQTTPLNSADDGTFGVAIGKDYDVDITTSDSKGIFASSEVVNGIGTFSTLTVNGNNITGGGDYSSNILGVQTTKTGSTFNVPKINGASTATEGLEGYAPGNLTRTYNLFKFNKCSSDWKVADLGMQLGYDFYKCDDKHFGLYIKAVVPTGTEIDKTFAKQVFSPVIGNGKHFELGAGLSAHAELWSCDENSFVVNIDGYLTHMFKKSQFRTFDKSNDPMSRYALVKQLTKTTFSKPADQYGYNYVLSPLGDFNNGYVDVSVDLKGEAVLDLTYSHKNWDFGVGYNFSGQSKEKMKNCSESSTDGYYYGYKGYSYENALIFGGAAGDGKTNVNARSDSNVIENSGSFKNAAYKYGMTAEHMDHQTKDTDVFTLPDFNRSGLMEGQISNKLFAHIDYVWSDCSWTPELGVLGSISFSPNSYKTAEYWDIGAKLGFSY